MSYKFDALISILNFNSSLKSASGPVFVTCKPWKGQVFRSILTRDQAPFSIKSLISISDREVKPLIRFVSY